MRLTPSEYGGLVPPPARTFTNRVSGPWRITTVLAGVLLLAGYATIAIASIQHSLLIKPSYSGISCWRWFLATRRTVPTSMEPQPPLPPFSSLASRMPRQSALPSSSGTNTSFFYIHYLCQSPHLRGLNTQLTPPRPFFIVNFIALFNILLNIFARDLFPLSTLRVVSIGLPSAFALIHGGAAILVYHEYGSSAHHRAENDTPLLSDEEMQRRQLARLLGDRSAAAPSPDINHSTYRLEIPTLEPVQKTWTPELSLPPASRFSSNAKSQWTSVNQSII